MLVVALLLIAALLAGILLHLGGGEVLVFIMRAIIVAGSGTLVVWVLWAAVARFGFFPTIIFGGDFLVVGWLAATFWMVRRWVEYDLRIR